MGCDIHMWAEKKINGKWEIVKNSDPEDPFEEGAKLLRPYDGRNYGLFAMLADVRNGSDYTPISNPKGVPTDVSKEYKEEVDSWGTDGHSHSYLTLKELVEYNWTQSTTHYGVMDITQYREWASYDKENNIPPKRYSGGVSGPNVLYISEEVMNNKIKEAIKKLGVPNNQLWQHQDELNNLLTKEYSNYYTEVQWPEYYYQTASEFLSRAMPVLFNIAGGLNNFENVRIVFFFDS